MKTIGGWLLQRREELLGSECRQDGQQGNVALMIKKVVDKDGWSSVDNNGVLGISCVGISKHVFPPNES